MEVLEKRAVNHQKVDLMTKAIHQITTMKTTVVNCRQTRKRTWKD